VTAVLIYRNSGKPKSFERNNIELLRRYYNIGLPVISGGHCEIAKNERARGNARPTSTIYNIIYYYLLPALSRRIINVPSVCYTDVALLGHRTREEHVGVWVWVGGWVWERERERGSVINIRFTLSRHKTRSSVTDWPTDVAFIGTT